MSAHVHDENCTFTSGAICGGTGRFYLARGHRPGAKTMEIVSRHRSGNAAIRAMTNAFIKNRHFWNRADVVFCDEWYEPGLLCEIRS